MFATKNSDKAFQFLHCWLKVRNCPKFQAVDKSHKTPRPSKSSTPAEGVAGEEEGDENVKSKTPDSAQGGQKKRPMGRKEAKKKVEAWRRNRAIQRSH